MDKLSINFITDMILTRCKSEEEVRELLSHLSSLTNWPELIATKELELNMWPCGICEIRKDRRLFTYVVNYNLAGRDSILACQACAASIELKVTCVVCDSIHPALSLPEKEFACGPCSSIFELVRYHNQRAIQAQLPATLTGKQWVATLQHFENKCAYCGGKYECLEHYLPISLDGGTVIGNCFPSCSRCDRRKGYYHPDTFDSLFPAENLARIRKYISQQV